MTTVAALYVDTDNGPYADMPGVECWGIEADARLYDGPHPVVSHPPCAAWCGYRLQRDRLWRLHKWDSLRFDAAGAEMICGPAAVMQVRRWGGVLEHPASSALWGYAGLPRPGLYSREAWGVTYEVWQGAYGHPAPKKTWLYVCGHEELVDFRGYRTVNGRVAQMWSRRHVTPVEFAGLLVDIARRCTPAKTNREALPGGAVP